MGMVDSSNSKDGKGIAHRLWEKLEKFWPISILLMAFTFLTGIEEVEKFSKYLNQFLNEWRMFLKGVIELPINVLLELFGMKPINILQPWPEIITFIFLFLFTYFRKSKLEKSKWVQALINKHWAFRVKVTAPFFEKISTRTIFLYFLGNFLGVVLLFWPLLIIGYVLFSTLTTFLEFMALTGLLVSFPIFMTLSAKKHEEKLNEAIELQGYIVAPAIIVLSLFIVVLAAALETIIPNVMSFVDRAS